jgi:hypothetical protein
MIYAIEDYNNILYSNFNYKLPEIQISIINGLLNEIASIITEEQSIDDKHKNKKVVNKRFNKRMDEPNWEKTKPFVATKMEKKEGVEKIMNDVRISFNKVSNKNYEIQRDLISQYLNEISTMENAEENIIKVKDALFDTASTNKFYSAIYALLYKELRDKLLQINENLEDFLKLYMDSINNIELADPNTDYDKYCNNNKLNDKRKGMAMFIVNLMKIDIIDKNSILKIIITLQDLVLQYVDEENKMVEVEEITENIFLLVTSSVKELSTESNWKSILDNIVKCSQMKVKEHKSISSRTIFKYMDVLDNIQC